MDDDSVDGVTESNRDFLSPEEIEEVVTRALRRYGYSPAEPRFTRDGKPHPLAPAGLKLRTLRERSGWTVSEVAERTGVPLDVLTAFEAGDSAAAGKLARPDLERLASACCGSLTDLLETEHPWARSRSSCHRSS